MKTTLKAIKAHPGTDITHFSFYETNDLRKRPLIEIAYSIGTYGINGALFLDRKTGEYFKITARSTALFQMI